MIIKARWKKLGGHIHVDVFTAKAPGLTWENCGTLVFRDYEWPSIQTILFKAITLEEKP